MLNEFLNHIKYIGFYTTYRSSTMQSYMYEEMRNSKLVKWEITLSKSLFKESSYQALNQYELSVKEGRDSGTLEGTSSSTKKSLILLEPIDEKAIKKLNDVFKHIIRDKKLNELCLENHP